MSAVTTNTSTTKNTQAAGIASVSLIAGIGVSLGATSLFAWIWHQVKDQGRHTTAFDRAVLTWMHTHQVPVLTEIARGLAFMGSPPVIMTIALLGAVIGLFSHRLRGAAWTLPLAVIGAGAIIQGIKLLFHRPRPTFFAPLLHESGYSFPSGHSLIAMVVYGLFGYFALSLFHHPKSRSLVVTVTTVLILAIGISRPYVQVHYPTDVLAGWTAGIPWLIACIGIHEVLARRFGAAAGKPVLQNAPAQGLDTGMKGS